MDTLNGGTVCDQLPVAIPFTPPGPTAAAVPEELGSAAILREQLDSVPSSAASPALPIAVILEGSAEAVLSPGDNGGRDTAVPAATPGGPPPGNVLGKRQLDEPAGGQPVGKPRKEPKPRADTALPPGFSRTVRNEKKKEYWYVAPDGSRHSSRAAAWRQFSTTTADGAARLRAAETARAAAASAAAVPEVVASYSVGGSEEDEAELATVLPEAVATVAVVTAAEAAAGEEDWCGSSPAPAAVAQQGAGGEAPAALVPAPKLRADAVLPPGYTRAVRNEKKHECAPPARVDSPPSRLPPE